MLQNVAGLTPGNDAQRLEWEPTRASPPAQKVQEGTEKDLAEATYFSPVVRVDVQNSTAVYLYRETSSGEVQRQYPNPEKLAAYESGAKLARTDTIDSEAVAKKQAQQQSGAVSDQENHLRNTADAHQSRAAQATAQQAVDVRQQNDLSAGSFDKDVDIKV